MKRCESCGQLVSQKVAACPGCGSRMMERITDFDGYRVLAIIHEGKSSIVCKAAKEDGGKPVSIRIFTKESGVDEHIAKRLETELELLKKLPDEHFVQHYSLKKSQDGYWYRLSEWVDAKDWGSIFMSGLLNDRRRIITLFRNIASVLDLLHKQDHFMPYLILDDILIPKKRAKELRVKINYKLSRFLNARATHHGPMLRKLLECHPDIKNERAIDFKTGIWSLGKIFVELLTADHNLTDFSSRVDEIKNLPPDLKVLIKIMLADDPDLRPRSMAHIVDALTRILDGMPYENAQKISYQRRRTIAGEMRHLKKAVIAMISLFIAVSVLGALAWLYIRQNEADQQNILSSSIESYTSSVAFVMVEYWLFEKENNQVVYRNKVEGTAFLADADGYLLTNRHVACPWLEDPNLFQVYHQFEQLDKDVDFDFRMYAWFEGTKAFKRLPALSNSMELSDAYHLASAYRSGDGGSLKIAGVPRTITKTGELLKAPFKNDFAVLKIEGLPTALKPLPLDAAAPIEKIKRLDQIIILGFPLGNRTQADHINTSITRGHVRRISKKMIQVDSSIYKGNSGGPAINSQENVIGIASGVVTEEINAYFKVSTPLSDFGLILPIDEPLKFIAAIKSNTPKWDGLLDFSIESKLEQISDLALDHKFNKAARLSELMLKSSNSPALFYAAGMMNFCTRELDKSRHFFERLCLLEPRNTTSRLMLYIIDWLKAHDKIDPLTKDIFKMEWHEEDEFLGYLANVLKQETGMKSGFIDYENRTEKSWRLFIEGLILEKRKDIPLARDAFENAILNAASNDWVYYIAFSRLNLIEKQIEKLAGKADKKAIKNRVAAFFKEARENRKAAAENRETIGALILEFESDLLSREEKIQTYTRLMELTPENRTVTGRVAFYHAQNGEWQQALDFINIFFRQPTRETSLSLSLNLMKGEILKILGLPKAAKNHLKKMLKEIRDPWYRIIVKHLLSKSDEKKLGKLAGKKPEKLVTMHTALGLWAEGEKDLSKATYHYREALSSYLDEWNEYDFSLKRIHHLRQAQK